MRNNNEEQHLRIIVFLDNESKKNKDKFNCCVLALYCSCLFKQSLLFTYVRMQKKVRHLLGQSVSLRWVNNRFKFNSKNREYFK